MDLQFLKLFLYPAPLVDAVVRTVGDTWKFLDIALENSGGDQERGTAHRVNLGLAVIDDQLVTLNTLLDPIQESLAWVFRRGI